MVDTFSEEKEIECDKIASIESVPIALKMH